MKTTFNFACAALLALFTSSCLEHTATIRLNKDGSGSITEETLLSEEVTAMMAQMAAVGGGEEPGAKFADAEKAADSAKKMGEGVTVEKVEKLDKDGRKGGRVTYAFKDINQVKFYHGDTMADAGKEMAPPGGAAKAENKPMRFKYEGGVLTLINPEQKPAGDATKPEKGDAPDDAAEADPQQLAMAQQMLKDLKMTVQVEIPGGIDETDASYVKGDTITLVEMPFGKLISDPAKLKQLEGMKDSNPAEIAAAFKDVEGMKIETKDSVTVKLK